MSRFSAPDTAEPPICTAARLASRACCDAQMKALWPFDTIRGPLKVSSCRSTGHYDENSSPPGRCFTDGPGAFQEGLADAPGVIHDAFCAVDEDIHEEDVR